MVKKFILLFISAMACMAASCALVDLDGNPATNETALADIDMAQGTLGDVKNAALDNVTNTVVVGFTSWTFSGAIEPGSSYNVVESLHEGSISYTLWNMTTSAELGTIVTNTLNVTYLDFTSSGISAQRYPIRRNAHGLAMYSDVEALGTKVEGQITAVSNQVTATSNYVENIDTSYIRVNNLTNKNQSVQYVLADNNTTNLIIQMPQSGMTKDWIVYVFSATNVTLTLPPANYWCINESVTNEIPSQTPTALYFSQINDDTYCIGRQTLIPITVPSQNSVLMESVRKRMTRKLRK